MLPVSGGISFTGGQKLRKFPTEYFKSPPYVYLYIPNDYKTIVNINDCVTIGQIVATSEDVNSVPIFSSISGIAEKFDNNILYIKNDFKETISSGSSPITTPLTKLKNAEIESIVKSLGIYDGNTPLFKKLKAAYGRIENIIINCTDSNPYDARSYKIIEEKFDELICGVKILIHSTKARVGIIAIDERIEIDFPTLNKKISDKELIFLRTIENKYPSGNEKVLLNALTRKELQTNNLISEGRSLIISSECAINLFNAFVHGFPQTKKLVSVSGAIFQIKNLYIPNGTNISDIIDFCGGKTDDNAIIVKNGLLNGNKISEDSVINNINSITVISEKKNKELQCIRCGKCLQVCPMLLKPLHIYLNIINNKQEKNKHLGADNCIGCGCCSYICPSNIPISQLIFDYNSAEATDNYPELIINSKP